MLLLQGARCTAFWSPGGHRKCALPNSNFHHGLELKVLLCLVKSQCGDSIDNGGDFMLMGFALLNLFQ
jgi:hypothetical protein